MISEEKHKRETKQGKYEKRLLRTNNKFSLLKNKMLNITANKASPLQKISSEATELGLESGRATRVNRGNKRDVDNKPRLNMTGPITATSNKKINL